MPEKDVIVQVSLVSGMVVALTTFWWRLTAKFARKDVLALHIVTLDTTLKELKEDSKEKWSAINEVAEGQSRIEGMLSVMVGNHKKREGDV